MLQTWKSRVDQEGASMKKEEFALCGNSLYSPCLSVIGWRLPSDECDTSWKAEVNLKEENNCRWSVCYTPHNWAKSVFWKGDMSCISTCISYSFLWATLIFSSWFGGNSFKVIMSLSSCYGNEVWKSKVNGLIIVPIAPHTLRTQILLIVFFLHSSF